MNAAILQLMSGPLMALVRYAVTAAGAAAAAKWGVDGQTVAAVSAGVVAAASAGIGALTSTKAAKIVTTAAIPGLKVTLPNGRTASSASEAKRLLDTGTD